MVNLTAPTQQVLLKRALILLGLAASFALPFTSAVAQTAAASNSVRVGAFTKPASGTVTEMTNGDIACYITIKDDQGRIFNELGEFSLCERPARYLKQRVKLSYTIANVMSDECGGDPKCKKTKSLALVSSMSIVDAKPTAAPAKSANASAEKGQASFCTPMETVIFSCRTGAKMVSVCASKNASRTAGYLQYRFGKPDSRDPLELTLPESELVASRAATGESVPFSGGAGSWLRFKRGAFSYTVYSGIGRWGPKGETRTKDGLSVERDGKLVANLKCVGAVNSELGPEWFEKTNVKPQDNEDFLFPD